MVRVSRCRNRIRLAGAGNNRTLICQIPDGDSEVGKHQRKCKADHQIKLDDGRHGLNFEGGRFDYRHVRDALLIE
jgi:hypothetical protein